MRWLVVFGLGVLVCSANAAFAQNWGSVEGRIVETTDETPIPGVTVVVQGTNYGTATNEEGQYALRLPAGRYLLRFSAVGYQTRTDSAVVQSNATTRVDAALTRAVLEMEGVTVEDDRSREAGVYEVDPEDVQNMPTPFKDGFRALKVVPGVATNNELSHQYSVRGGGYNENLIFINGFEVYMPFRPRQGEQEGLGLLNPDLARSITFYTGGFPARYGGKLASALDVDYGAPEGEVTGAAALSLLDASVSAGGSALDDRLSWNMGVRKARAQRFFSTQELKGDYEPDFTDVQGLVRYRLAPGHAVEALGIWADHEFQLDPSNQKTYFGILSRDPNVPSDLQAIWTQFDGTQRDGYTTRFGGVRVENRLSDRLRVQHDAAYFGTEEREFFNIQGSSELFQVDPGGNPNTGAGHFGIGRSQQIDRADNVVTVNTLTGSGQYNVNVNRHALETGWHVRRLRFDDRLDEKSVIRARVSAESQQQVRIVADSLVDQATLNASQVGFYVQDAIDVLPTRDRLILTAGLRTDYYSFNGEWTVSPRLSARFLASERLTLTGSWGLYHQKPTYRELRGKPDPGESILDALNRDLISQRSSQFVAGGEYFLPAKRLYVRAEAYYKDLDHVVSYDIENIRVEYSGENDAYGHIYGLDLQLRGEFVPGLESWFNYSYMVARERFEPAFQTRYNQGLIPRPTDQRHTFSAFVQDYVPGDKTWKLHLRALYGSGLPYTPPVPGPNDGPEGVVQVPGPRMAGRLSPYRRVDLGATKEITVSEDLFANPVQLDLTLEILNIFDMTNTVSYTWVPDSGNEWTRIPKRLTPRTLNARVRVRF
jgi:hypothetical protein